MDAGSLPPRASRVVGLIGEDILSWSVDARGVKRQLPAIIMQASNHCTLANWLQVLSNKCLGQKDPPSFGM